MKLKTIVNPNTTTAMNSILGIPMPLKASYQLSKIAKKLQAEIEGFNETRMGAIKRLAVKDEKGELVVKDGQVEFTDENKEIFLKEISDLGEVEVAIDPIPLSHFGEKVEIPAATLVALGDLIQMEA